MNLKKLITRRIVIKAAAEEVKKSVDNSDSKDESTVSVPEVKKNKHGKIDFPSKRNDIKAIVEEAYKSCQTAESGKYANDGDLEDCAYAYLDKAGYMFTTENVSEIADALKKKFKTETVYILQPTKE